MGAIMGFYKYFALHNHNTFNTGVSLFAQGDAFNSAKQKPGRD